MIAQVYGHWMPDLDTLADTRDSKGRSNIKLLAKNSPASRSINICRGNIMVFASAVSSACRGLQVVLSLGVEAG